MTQLTQKPRPLNPAASSLDLIKKDLSFGSSATLIGIRILYYAGIAALLAFIVWGGLR